MFDNIAHELLQRAVRKHVTGAWAPLYTMADSAGGARGWNDNRAKPRYPRSAWCARSSPTSSCTMHMISGWHRCSPISCRYADDRLVHYRNEMEAQSVRQALEARLAGCGLELHPTKTRIVYCKDDRRRGKSETVSEAQGRHREVGLKKAWSKSATR
ncbi:reverse transcriptase domain-containing protein [Bradyrhizobium niftali]|uniref:reverse transcriptase domain-containing protein n=1 Tax=Bradyrhizobium niftali TaxID=2560055 RepID=UPI00384CE2A4